MQSTKKYIQLKVLKVFYWETRWTGAIPVKINEARQEIKFSPVIMMICIFWLISTSLSSILFVKWLIVDTSDFKFSSKLFWIGSLVMNTYSVGTFLLVCMKSKEIIFKMNRVVESVKLSEIECIISKEILFEFVNLNVILIILDYYAYNTDWNFFDKKNTAVFMSFYPRRFVLLAVFLVLHFSSEVLKLLRNKKTSPIDLHFALNCILEVLIVMNQFVQFAILFNSLMFMKNSYFLCSGIIKLAMAQNNDVGKINHRQALFLPTEFTRLWTIIKSCSEVNEELKKMVEAQPKLAIFIKNRCEKISLLKNDNRILLSVSNNELECNELEFSS